MLDAGLDDPAGRGSSTPQRATRRTASSARSPAPLWLRGISVTGRRTVRERKNIEIESSGGLPAHITTANILKERYARNRAIVRWINRFPEPPNKDVGEGSAPRSRPCAVSGLKPPEIVETRNYGRPVEPFDARGPVERRGRRRDVERPSS